MSLLLDLQSLQRTLVAEAAAREARVVALIEAHAAARRA